MDGANAAGTAAARFAEKWEPVIFRESTRILCMTEAMQKHYEKKYGIRTDLLPHCVPEQEYLSAPAENAATKDAQTHRLVRRRGPERHESGLAEDTGECL